MTEFSGTYDHYDDNGLLLRKEMGSKGIPPVIKTATDLSNPATRHDGDYAVVADTNHGVVYKYPVSDAGNAVASAVYFSEYGHKLPQGIKKTAAKAINDALVDFGFTPPEDLTKTASMELGYSGEGDNISLEKLFGIGGEDDPMELVEDAFSKLSPRGKSRLAMQVKEAGLMEAAPEELLDYLSSDEPGVGANFDVAVDTRKLVLLDPAAAGELDELQKTSQSKFLDPEAVAEELSLFDQKHQITHLYDRVIIDPWKAVHGDLSKTASHGMTIDADQLTDVAEVAGKEYTSDAISTWVNDSGLEKLTDAFGEDFAGEFKEDPANVFKSLPVTHRNAIARMIDES
jgi:hypothetical protein